MPYLRVAARRLDTTDPLRRTFVMMPRGGFPRIPIPVPGRLQCYLTLWTFLHSACGLLRKYFISNRTSFYKIPDKLLFLSWKHRGDSRLLYSGTFIAAALQDSQSATVQITVPGADMNRYMKIIPLALLALILSIGTLIAGERKETREGPYLVLEGQVSAVHARMLVIEGQSYPVSKFVRVFAAPSGGAEIPMHQVVNVGRIDLAKVYLLGGKVEKIVVLLSK